MQPGKMERAIMTKVKKNSAWNGDVVWRGIQAPEEAKGSTSFVIEFDSWPVVVTEGVLALNTGHPKVAAALRAADDAGKVTAFRFKAEGTVVAKIKKMASFGEMRHADGSWNIFYASDTASHTMLDLINEMGLSPAKQAA